MAPQSDKQITLRDGRCLGYAEFGDPRGKPVLFFHGYPGSRWDGAETGQAAERVGVRLIAPDRPGMGLSDYQLDQSQPPRDGGGFVQQLYDIEYFNGSISRAER